MDSPHAKSDMTTKLPTELLSRVFRRSGSLRRPEHSYTGQRSTRMPPEEEYITLGKSTYILDSSKCPTRFAILLVCHRWRDIALADSSLWTDIEIDDPSSPLLCFLFEYSRNSPLMFSGWTQIPSPVVQGRTRTILDHLSRIKILSFDFPGPEPTEFSHMIKSLFSANVLRTALKTLRLRWSARSHALDVAPYQILDITSLPSSLSLLALDRVLPSTPSPREGITSFHIENTPLPWKCHLPGALLEAIRNMPCLESLHIKYDVGRTHSSRTPRVEPATKVLPIALPRLGEFHFSGTPTHYLYMIPALCVPMKSSRNIELYEDYWYDSEQVPEGWVPPASQLGDAVVSPEVLNNARDNFLCNIHNILASRNSGSDRDETFGVHFSLLFVEDEFILKILVTLASRRRPVSSTFDDAVNMNHDDNTAPVLSIQYTVPAIDEYDPDELEEHEKDITRAVILPCISSISRAFHTSIVYHLHLSSNVSIVPELRSSIESNTDEDFESEEWTPSFLEWTEVRSLHVEGKGMAEWIVPHLSKTRQVMFREGPKWRKETTISVLPGLQELLLDKIDRAFRPRAAQHYDEIWSFRWVTDITDMTRRWELVFKVRAACEGQKLQRLITVEGYVWSKSQWYHWRTMLRTSGWVEDNNVWFVHDSTYSDPEYDTTVYSSEDWDAYERSRYAADCLDTHTQWRRKFCIGLCHDFCRYY